MLHASMIVVGDEILGGYVTDTNSPWLADRLRVHGVPFERVHVVPDEMSAIDEAVQAELARSRPRVVFTSGGIGSTPDDLTYEAVAASLGRGLVEDPRIAARIERALDWSREQGLDVDEAFTWHLMRMARIPEGSRLLLRDRGWAPGIAVDLDGGSDADEGCTVVILPGVPREFRAIVSETVEPELLAARNEVPTVEELTHRLPESALNTTFVAVQDTYPQVKLGSYPGRPMMVRLTGPYDEVRGAAAMVRRTLDAIESTPAGQRIAAAWAVRHADPEEES